MNPKIRPLSLRHYDGDLICQASRARRRWAYIKDAAGTAMVVIVFFAAFYLFAAILDVIWPNGVVGQ